MPIYKMSGKKDGLQQYRVRVNYVDSTGKARQIDRVAYGNAEAKDLERKLTQEIKEKPTASRFTVNELFKVYMDQKQYEVRATSLKRTEDGIKLYVLPCVGELKLDKLVPRVLEEWKLNVSKTELSVSAKKNIYAHFRAMLNYAVKMEYTVKNPLVLVGNFKDLDYAHEKDKIKYYTAEEFKMFISSAKEDAESTKHYGFYIFFSIAFYTGMRKGEINALKWSDIEDNTITVRRSVSQALKGADIVSSPKNKSSYRSLVMPIPLINILEEHKGMLLKNKGYGKNNYICGGDTALRDATMRFKSKAYAKKAGLREIPIHGFRHSHASLLANAGINIQEVARRLGHSKIEITWNTYSHLYPKEEEKAVEVLNKIHL